MKYKLILLYILFVCRLPVLSQTYSPFPDSNATWCAQRSFLAFGPPDSIFVYNYILSYSGDTVISGQTYYKIYESGELIRTPLPGGVPIYSYYSNNYVGCIRESNNKEIHYIDKYSSIEGILYDFKLSIGDTLSFATNLMVTSIDSIFDGIAFRARYNLSSIDTITWPFPGYYEHVSLIEGIGSTGGLLWSLGPYFEHWGVLYNFQQNGIVYYQDTSFNCNISLGQTDLNSIPELEVFPVPCKDIINIKLNADLYSEYKIVLMNTLGQEILKESLDPGVSALNMEMIYPGIYLYKIYDKFKIISVGKLIKQ